MPRQQSDVHTTRIHRTIRLGLLAVLAVLVALALLVGGGRAGAVECKRKAFPFYGQCWSRFEGRDFTRELRRHGVDPWRFAKRWPQLARVFRGDWPGPRPWSDAWLTERTPNRAQLWRIAVCETGGINGGVPLWTHHNSVYSGALGFVHSTWSYYAPARFPRPAAAASPAQQLYVGQILVYTFGGYSSWPACSVRLGLR